MSAKKKMIIAISAFSMVLLATIIAVVAVLAAQQVTVKSSLTVNYAVSDVIADVEVYAVKVKTNASTIDWGTAKTANFNSTGYVSGGTLTGTVGGNQASGTFSNFALAKDECVVLKFVFNNNSASKSITATLGTISTSGKNVNLYYSATEASLLESTTTTSATVNVAAGTDKTVSYFAVIKIADDTKNVTDFQPSFNWTLA